LPQINFNHLSNQEERQRIIAGQIKSASSCSQDKNNEQVKVETRISIKDVRIKAKLSSLQNQAKSSGTPVLIDGLPCIKKKMVNKNTQRLNSILACGMCNREFDKRCNLKDHLRVHSGLKPFKCPHCGKSFK
jgi:uncharacterized Zn-finger protein